MEYIQLLFVTEQAAQNEMLIALLSDAGFEGFEEQDGALTATITSDQYDEAAAREIAQQLNLSFTKETLQQQNWNAIWEAGFQPVTVPGFCTVRAAFHPRSADTPYEVIITPKMSFGTGHHATTHLMIEAMQRFDFKNLKVLDFGTGTGILAILSKKLGATNVLAIDNDEWAVTNAIENAQMNKTGIDIVQGSLEVVDSGYFQIILANINRNILLQYMDDMSRLLVAGGHLILSGILLEDETAVVTAAKKTGLRVLNQQAMNGWMCITFSKEI